MERQSVQDFQTQLIRYHQALTDAAMGSVQHWVSFCSTLMETTNQTLLDSYNYYTCAFRLVECDEAPAMTRNIKQAAE